MLWSYIDWPFISISIPSQQKDSSIKNCEYNTYTSGFCKGGGDWIIDAFILRIRIIIDTRRGRIGMLKSILRHPHKRLHCITQQSNRVGGRLPCGYYGREAFIWGIMPDFYYFGAWKMGWFFGYFGINGILSNAWDKQTIYKPTMNALDGVCDATWVWRVDRTKIGAFFVWKLVPHIPSSEQPFWQ